MCVWMLLSPFIQEPRTDLHYGLLRLVLSPELLGRGVACPPGLQWEPAPSQQSPGTSDAASGVSPEVPQTGRQYVIDDRELPARGLVLQL